jgi:NAD(P)H-nitrite reductase large subunit
MKYVIIGNSAGGIGAVEAIRKYDAEGEIVILSDEPHHTYSRPLISYYLGGKVTEERMLYRPLDFYTRLRVMPMLGKRVAAVDTRRHIVQLEDRQAIGYERLLVATGGTPFIPAIENGVRGETFHTFTTWDEARQLKRAAQDVKHAVVVGGGLIGIKAAEGLSDLGIKVTIVELAGGILSMALDETASGMMKEAAQGCGIEVITGTTVARIETNGKKVSGVQLKDGAKVPCQLVVVAIGVVPNTALLKGSEVALGRGVLVDDKMATNVAGVFAAGDVAEGPSILEEARRVVPIWPNAYRMGKVAGMNMAGKLDVYGGSMAMNSVEINHLPVISIGLSRASGPEFEVLTRLDRNAHSYRKIVIRDNVVVGAIMVNTIDRAGIVTGLIRDKVDVRNFKESLIEDRFGYISLPRQLRRARLETIGVKLGN